MERTPWGQACTSARESYPLIHTSITIHGWPKYRIALPRGTLA